MIPRGARKMPEVDRMAETRIARGEDEVQL